MVQPPKLGALVYSLAGRDAGGHYVVIGTLDSNFVLVANGLNRPLERPKKKNLRHLKTCQHSHAGLVEKLRLREALDKDIIQAICEMVGITDPGRESEGNKPDVKEEGRN